MIIIYMIYVNTEHRIRSLPAKYLLLLTRRQRIFITWWILPSPDRSEIHSANRGTAISRQIQPAIWVSSATVAPFKRKPLRSVFDYSYGKLSVNYRKDRRRPGTNYECGGLLWWL